MNLFKNKNEVKNSKSEKNITTLTSNYFDLIAHKRKSWLHKAENFHKEDALMVKEFISPGSKILELGCGNGQLLSRLESKTGFGIDISSNLIDEAKKDFPNLHFIKGDIANASKLLNKKGTFDYVLLSDTIGYLDDVQSTLESLHPLFNSNTRLIVSYYAPIWTPLFSLATLLKLKMPNLNTTLLSPSDIKSFLKISNFESVRIDRKIMMPFKLFGLGRIINRFIATLPIISNLCLRHYIVSRSIPKAKTNLPKSASIIVPCKNEFGNIRAAIERTPKFTKNIEIIFVEGNSKDGTWEEIKSVLQDKKYKTKGFDIRAYKQKGKGKADAVFQGFDLAKNDVLMILDGDLTVSPEVLGKFWKKIASGEAEYINGTRLVYPMDDNAMQFLNHIANRLFSILFTWILGQRYTDTLCGTKVLRKHNYIRAKQKNLGLGSFDPFGDFFIIFGASRLSLKMIEVPIRYKARSYGETQISRFSHGFLLVKMVIFAFFKIKAI